MATQLQPAILAETLLAMLPENAEYADKLEAMMLGQEGIMYADDFPPNHYFSKGTYIREIILPPGLIAIGHRHKVDCLNIMLKGSMVLLDEPGKLTYLKAPCTFYGEAGKRKAGIVTEELIFQNVFATEEKDIDKLEVDLFEHSPVFNKWEELQLEESNLIKEGAKLCQD